MLDLAVVVCCFLLYLAVSVIVIIMMSVSMVARIYSMGISIGFFGVVAVGGVGEGFELGSWGPMSLGIS